MAYPPPPLLLHPPPPVGKHQISSVYYILEVLGLLVVVLAIFYLFLTLFLAIYKLIVGFWTSQSDRSISRSPHQSLENFDINLVSFTFMYRKEETESTDQEQENDPCVVCLSSFQEGVDVRQLVQCKHSFHVCCIDTWLHSHSDCPLCRTVIRPSVSDSTQSLSVSENSV